MAPDLSGIERAAAERLEGLMQGALPTALPTDGLDGDALRLATAVNRFIEFQREVLGFIGPLSRGDLRAAVPAAQNLLASPFKELQSRLVHLTWQAEQVARGDYSQRVDFMGDFSRAFNAMVESLAAKERELRERIEELQGLNRIKDEFVGMAAHDLRSPLAVVEMYASFLLEDPKSCLTPKEREFLRVIKNQGRFMLNLINDLLDVTRIESGHLDLKLLPGDWVEFVRRNVDLNAALAARRGVAIDADVARGAVHDPLRSQSHGAGPQQPGRQRREVLAHGEPDRRPCLPRGGDRAHQRRRQRAGHPRRGVAGALQTLLSRQHAAAPGGAQHGAGAADSPTDRRGTRGGDRGREPGRPRIHLLVHVALSRPLKRNPSAIRGDASGVIAEKVYKAYILIAKGIHEELRHDASRNVSWKPAAGLCVLTVVALLPAPPAAASFKYLKPGMEAADFTLRTLDDQELTLADLRQGPALLLVFWATWSPKSELALREAQALHERYAGAKLRVVAVNLDRPEMGLQERAGVEKAARDFGLTMAVALDPGFAAASSIGVVANPSCALIDARGVLVWDGAGWSRSMQESLREQVEGLLGLRETPAAGPAKGHRPEHKALLNYNLGRTFLRQGNPGKARDLLESAAQADPAWSAPRTLLGHLLLQQAGGRGLAQAEALFREAVAIDPGDVSALTGLGEALLLADRVEDAAPFLQKAHELDPSFTPAVAGYARVLARQGRLAEALTLYAAALELNPRDAAILVGRAECREAAGSLADATTDYRSALEVLLGVR